MRLPTICDPRYNREPHADGITFGRNFCAKVLSDHMHTAYARLGVPDNAAIRQGRLCRRTAVALRDIHYFPAASGAALFSFLITADMCQSGCERSQSVFVLMSTGIGAGLGALVGRAISR